MPLLVLAGRPTPRAPPKRQWPDIGATFQCFGLSQLQIWVLWVHINIGWRLCWSNTDLFLMVFIFILYRIRGQIWYDCWAFILKVLLYSEKERNMFYTFRNILTRYIFYSRASLIWNIHLFGCMFGTQFTSLTTKWLTYREIQFYG